MREDRTVFFLHPSGKIDKIVHHVGNNFNRITDVVAQARQPPTEEELLLRRIAAARVQFLFEIVEVKKLPVFAGALIDRQPQKKHIDRMDEVIALFAGQRRRVLLVPAHLIQKFDEAMLFSHGGVPVTIQKDPIYIVGVFFGLVLILIFKKPVDGRFDKIFIMMFFVVVGTDMQLHKELADVFADLVHAFLPFWPFCQSR